MQVAYMRACMRWADTWPCQLFLPDHTWAIHLQCLSVEFVGRAKVAQDMDAAAEREREFDFFRKAGEGSAGTLYRAAKPLPLWACVEPRSQGTVSVLCVLASIKMSDVKNVWCAVDLPDSPTQAQGRGCAELMLMSRSRPCAQTMG